MIVRMYFHLATGKLFSHKKAIAFYEMVIFKASHVQRRMSSDVESPELAQFLYITILL